MRYALLPLFALILGVSSAHAQSVTDDLPPAVVIGADEDEGDKPEVKNTKPAAPTAETFTITDVGQDVSADTAAHARDKALMLAERTAYGQLCARLGATDNNVKLDDDALAGLVQSFEVQSERASAGHYSGVFTIRFKPISAQKKIGIADPVPAMVMPNGIEAKAAATGPAAHMTVAIQTNSLADWAQIKRRLGAVPQVMDIETLDLGRGLSHIDLAYNGTIDNLKNAVTNQGFVLRQNSIGIWELTDGSMVPR